jgi:hypothetical protein
MASGPTGTTVETFVDESHFMVRLIRCIACGRGYAYIFAGTIDWVGGNDPQGDVRFPITDEQAAELRACDERASNGR